MLNNLLVALEGTGASVDWSTLITSNSFSGIIDGINDVLPVVIPVAFTIMSIGIVWGFVKRFILGA